MSDTRKADKLASQQSEAHTSPVMPIYEYQIPVYGSPSDNSTSVQSHESKDFGLDRVSLNNVRF
ncbi:hypothetical protein NKI78_27040 [Mesorhizobium sp. M0400]|uniref:hypothetical protein n=1 Tax=Mesorhizobium sp. M0400 TaxID=2956941 RepID=UPI00333919AA